MSCNGGISGLKHVQMPEFVSKKNLHMAVLGF